MRRPGGRRVPTWCGRRSVSRSCSWSWVSFRTTLIAAGATREGWWPTGCAPAAPAGGQNVHMARKPVHTDPQPLDSGGGAHRGGGHKEGDRRRRGARVGGGVAVILLVWFAVANLRDVRIDFWVFHRQA